MGKRKGLTADLNRYQKVGLDSSILIYHLEGLMPYADLTEAIFRSLARGEFFAALSTISVTELLAKPLAEEKDEAVALCEQFLQGLPYTTIIAPSYAIAREAARLRGHHGLRTPDALLLATALSEGAKAFLTNDAAFARIKEEIAILFLEDYL